MKTITRYACEICGTEFLHAEDAERCEAEGLPEPMPFLRFGEKLPAFGEDGVEWGEVRGVYVVGRGWAPGGHEWVLDTVPRLHLSHNRDPESSGTPAHAFDPRSGWDAFRYSCTSGDVDAWRKAMRDYGFQESEVAASILRCVLETEKKEKNLAQLEEQRKRTGECFEMFGEVMKLTGGDRE